MESFPERFHGEKSDLFNTDNYSKKIFIYQVLISLWLTGGTEDSLEQQLVYDTRY